MKDNDEVNISNPTEAQLQAINPYNFLDLYKKGYDATLNSNGNSHVVHLTASTTNSKIKELFITVDKKSYHPTQVKLLQGKKWTIFDITNMKKQSANDAEFRFNAKDFPHAEIIDLR
jgi:outer membrane lipoprotein-sorting protein